MLYRSYSRSSLITYFTNSCVAAAVWLLSRVQLFVNPWIVARQAPLSMGFPRQEYWSGLPCPSRDLPDARIEPMAPAWQADSLALSHLGSHINSSVYMLIPNS